MALSQDTSFQLSTKSNAQSFLVPSIILVALFVSILLVFQGEDVSEFPVFITDAFTFTAWVNQGEDYLKEHYRWITRLIASYVKEGYFMLEDFLLESSWLFVTALLLIPSMAFGGLRLGILVLFGTMYWGMVGLWDSAMETLALMGLSVLLSVIVGIILGIFCSLSDRFERGMKPAKSGRFLVGNPLGLDPMAEMPVVFSLELVA